MVNRVILGVPLRRNPTTISVNNLMPNYSGFQPLDGLLTLIEKKNRVEITLNWENIDGSDLLQINNIIKSTQIDNSRDVIQLFYNDYHILEGKVILVGSTVEPVAATGSYYTELNHDAHIYIPVRANVTLTLIPVECKYLVRV